MTDSEDSRWAFSRRTVSLVAIANLLPLLGIAFLGWGVLELLIVYWVEALVGFLLGLATMLPARLVRARVTDPRREPVFQARHGTVSVGGREIAYVRTIPIVVRLTISVAFLWGFQVATLLAAGPPLENAIDGTTGSLALVAAVLAGTHVLTTWQNVREQGWEDRAPIHRAGLATFLSVLVLWAVLVIAIRAAPASGFDGIPAGLASVAVGGKLALSLLFQCRGPGVERLDGDADLFDGEATTTAVGPLRLPGSTIGELPQVEDPSTLPQETVRPSRWSILRASPILGIAESRVGGLTVTYLVVAPVMAVAGVDPVFIVLLGGVVVAPAVLYTLVIHLPRHASVAYEFHDDRLLCRDRWTTDPVWSLSYDDVESVSVERGLSGRIGGYGTVVVETADERPARLRFLRHYEDVAGRLADAAERSRPVGSAPAPRVPE